MKMGTKRGIKKFISLLLVMIMIFTTVPISAIGEGDLPAELEAPLAKLNITGDVPNLPIAKIIVTTSDGTSKEFTSLPIEITGLLLNSTVTITIEALEGYRTIIAQDSISIDSLDKNHTILSTNFEQLEVDTPIEEDLPPDGEGDLPPDGEGDLPPDGEGDLPPDGEGDLQPDGEGDLPPDGEGDLQPDGEGDLPPDGEGDLPPDGEGDLPPDGEGDLPPDEETTPTEGEEELMPDEDGDPIPYEGTLETGEARSFELYYPAPEANRVSGMSLMASILNPGDVDTESLITPTPGMVNTWDVTLRVYGKEASTTSDIVLVIDRSGSMGGSRYTATKAAAKQFVNTLLAGNGSQNTRIAIVSFSSDVTLNRNFTNSISQLNNTIDNLPSANGFTFTQGALKQADVMLNSSSATYKNIVLLSDGEPTMSYRMTDPDPYATIQIPGNQGWETNTLSPAGNYRYSGNNNTIGSGTSRSIYYNTSGSSNDRYYNHGNSAIAEAGFAKTGSDPKTVYTIAFEAGSIGTPILNTIASPGKAYNATQSDLQQAFDSIAASIMSAMTSGSAPDIMDQGFEVSMVGPISTIGSNYTLSGTNLNWSIPTLNVSTAGVTGLRYNDPTINYAELKFRMTINDEIIADDAVDITGNFNPFSGMEVAYLDLNGNPQSISMEQNKVDPVLIVVKKAVLPHGSSVTTNADGSGTVTGTPIIDTGRRFIANVRDVTTNNLLVNSPILNGERILVKDIRIEDRYTVSEAMTGWEILVNGSWLSANTTDYGDPKVIVTQGTANNATFGANGSSLTFDINSQSPDAEFTIYNIEEALGKLKVEKVVSLQQTAARSSTMALTSVPIQEFTINITGNTNDSVNLEGGESQTFEDIPYGTYNVSETPVSGFNASYSPGQSIDVTIRDKYQNLVPTVTVTNTKSVASLTIDVTATKTWDGGSTADHTAVGMTLMRSYGTTEETVSAVPTITPTTTGQASYSYSWVGLERYHTPTGTEYTYFVKETAENNGTVTINGRLYDVTYSDDGLEVTNKYRVPLTDPLVGTKVWAGLLEGSTDYPTDLYFQLMRRSSVNTTGEAVGTPQLVNTPGTTTGQFTTSWPAQALTDGLGNVYTYYVAEVNYDGSPYVNPNYISTINGMIATNVVRTEGLGTIKFKKLIDNTGLATGSPDVSGQTMPTNGEQVTFKISITRTGGNSALFDIVAGQEYSIGNLPYGEYTFLELDTEGYIPSYSPDDNPNAAGTKFVINDVDGQREVTVVMTNSHKADNPPDDPDPNRKTMSATKYWVGGPATDHNDIVLELVRVSQKLGSVYEIVSDDFLDLTATVDYQTYTWTDLPVHDTEGYIYNYEIREKGMVNGEVTLESGNVYTVTERDGNFINTLKIDTTDIVATKTFASGPAADYNSAVLELFRTTAGSTTENNVDVTPLKSGINPITFTWEDLPTTDNEGNVYTYVVREANVVDGKVTINGNTYAVEYGDNNSVTNTFEAESGDITFTKRWSGTYTETVYFKLFRRLASETSEVEVTGAGIKALISPATSVTWEDMELTNANDEPYIYSVKEYTDAAGTLEMNATNGNFEYSVDLDTKVVTNTFVSDKGDFRLTKSWEGGPLTVGNVTFMLQRSKDGTVWEDVPDSTKLTTNNIVLWEKIDIQDENAELYQFRTVEIDVPTGYRYETGPAVTGSAVEVVEMTGTNIFDPDMIDFSVIKNWKIDTLDEGLTLVYPKVELQLQRKLVTEPDSAFVPVPGAVNEVITETDVDAEWNNLPADLDDVDYVYRAVEIFTDPDDILNDNWVVHYSPDNTLVINRLIDNPDDEDDPPHNPDDPEDPHDPDHPNEKVASLTISKSMDEEVESNLVFKFRVTGPYGYTKDIEMRAGESVTLEKLYYGYYTVTEIESHGYTPSYSQETVALRKDASEASIEIINSMSNMDITVNKIWKNHSGKDIPVTVQLYRNGVRYLDPVTFTNRLSYTFRNLPISDGETNYRYTVDEINTPSFFKKTVQGFNITNEFVPDLTPIIWPPAGGPLLNMVDHIAFVQGYPEGDFRAENPITRAEAVMIFARLMVESMNINTTYTNPYNDVPLGKWYSNAIGYLTQRGIVNGYPDGSFRPDNPITRAEFAKLASGFDNLASGSSNFPDVASTHWAKRFIDSAYTKGWVQGYPDGTFRPENHIRRSEVVTIVNRMLNRQADKAFVENNPTLIRHYWDLSKSHWAYYEIMEASHTHDYTRPAPNAETWIRIKPNR